MTDLKVQIADRIQYLPPYLFATLDKIKQEAASGGQDIINLGIGDPDLPTPDPIVKRMQEAAADPRCHRYPSYEGLLSFRREIAAWYQRRFGVTLDPNHEVLTLIGSKEGIGHLPLALVNPGDIVLMTSPGYPVYHAGTLFAGGQSYFVPLRKENNFLPDFSQIPPDVCGKAKLLFINSPNNPTTATADLAFFNTVVAFAVKHQILVCHDAAYSEIYYDGKRPASFLEATGAKEVGVEFHSLSKTFNMTGWRIGFVVGHRAAIAGLGKLKSNLDSGVFEAVQEAGIAALRLGEETLTAIRMTYQERRDVFVSGLTKLGWNVSVPPASFYVWASVPDCTPSTDFVTRLIEKTGIVATPGVGFGQAGEGYIRLTLTVPVARLHEALGRMKQAGFAVSTCV